MNAILTSSPRPAAASARAGSARHAAGSRVARVPRGGGEASRRQRRGAGKATGPQRPAQSPVRTCVGCGQHVSHAEALRWVFTELAQSERGSARASVTLDLKGGGLGRGAWVHPRIECLEKAARHGFSRSFRTRVEVTPGELTAQIGAAAERRLGSLLHAARATRSLVFGRDAVREHEATAILVLLAQDAPSLATASFVQQFGARGRLIIWGTKARYGTWLGRGDVAILAISEHGLATRIAQTLALLNLAPSAVPGSGAADIVSEVR